MAFHRNTQYGMAVPASFLSLAFWAAPAAALERSMAQYQHFFPGWSPILEDVLDGECEEVMSNYNNASWENSRVSYRVLDCILNDFPEFRKAELGASSVVLGVAPALDMDSVYVQPSVYISSDNMERLWTDCPSRRLAGGSTQVEGSAGGLLALPKLAYSAGLGRK